MPLTKYVTKLNDRFKLGVATEHSYRGDLQNLLEELLPEIAITNEPTRISCGAPDYILSKNQIPIGYIEAKDIGEPLDSKKHKEQFERYKSSLGNLIITDYLEFQFYRDGALVSKVKVGSISGKAILPAKDGWPIFVGLIKDFKNYHGQTLSSAEGLAKMMANKTKLLAAIIESALKSDEETDANTSLMDQLDAFRQILIHDIDAKAFSDIYAQTIAYGMFAARIHDKTLGDFSRQEAALLIPKSNPFLRKLFQYIAGYDLDGRIEWVVESLVDIFRAADIAKIVNSFGKLTERNDPIIHFYETFLAEYDPALRKSRGVWYTPEPVVGFIVRAVDEVLRKDFALEMGIADSSKISIKTKVAVKGKTKNSRTTLKDYEREVHKVQLLDPACGTGTFLAETIKQIYKEFDSIPGAWPAYVDEHLIPRLHGFELLMASYAMAHLKVDLLLRETGYKSRSDDQRLRIFLTNALEEHHPDTGTLFATWLSNEAQEANYVKRDTPVMVVIGNPPYSGVSSNMSPWINELIEDYKYVDGEHFREKKHWLHDDYVKFIRNAQFYIEKNGEGILAFINNHAFLNNPTFRGMRNNILLAFDKIYILNLHGNLNDGDLHGVNDENVFDIKKGVSINIFVKNGRKKGRLADVYYADLTGSRESKYNFLFDNSLSTVKFDKLEVEAPYYFLSPVKAEKGISYDGWPSIADIFPIGTMGYASAQDKLTVSFEKHSLRETVDYFVNHTEAEIKSRFQIKKESRDWTVASAKRDLQINNDDNFIIKTAYRPFDIRYTYYTGTSRGFYASPQKKVMQHLINKENIAFCCCKINRDYSPTYWLAQQAISKSVISSLDNAYVFPLYLYPDDGSEGERIPNISTHIISEFEKSTGLSISEMEGAGKGTFRPIDLLDYVYAILHCSDYRDKYKEQLKVEYPRIPYPKNANAFFELAQLGAQLRDIHLMSWSSLGKSVVRFPIVGPNTITKKISERSLELTDPSSKAGRIWINDEQYFENIDANIWSHWIGGYQPAVKWLKDREGLTLDLANIQHYQKIILALVRTDEISKEVGIAYQKHF